MASCSQARSLSPTHAAIIAKHAIIRGPLDRIFFYWKQLDGAPALAQRFLFSPEGGVD